jgi:nitrogen regulatory protein P-II 1
MPQLVELVVHDPGMVDGVIRKWLEAGVAGITILDCSGLAQYVHRGETRDDLPLFPSVRRVLQSGEQPNRLLFSVVADNFDVEGLIAATESVLGPLSDPDTGILFVLPVSRVVGRNLGRAAPDRGG